MRFVSKRHYSIVCDKTNNMSLLGGSQVDIEPWWWEKVDPNRTGVSGDFAKEFKNETVKEPGMFAADHIPAEASLLVREAIQNSWDAASERYENTASGGGGGQSASRSQFGFDLWRLLAQSATYFVKYWD